VKKNIYGVTLDELKEYMCEIGETAAKGVFLYKKLYGRELNPTRENVSEELWARVQADFDFSLPRQVAVSEGADTCKYLFELVDGNTIETVLMKYSAVSTSSTVQMARERSLFASSAANSGVR
jgi:23S rRNA (adenine2503-C2)-methyltransferase